MPGHETIMQLIIPEGNVAVAYKVYDEHDLNSSVWVCSRCGEVYAKLVSMHQHNKGHGFCTHYHGCCMECAKEDMWGFPRSIFDHMLWARNFKALDPNWMAWEIDVTLQYAENLKRREQSWKAQH